MSGQLRGPWQVDFQPGRGAPKSITLGELAPLDHHPNPGVRYFAGLATYRTVVAIPAGAPTDTRWLLDLGEVHDLAAVKMNDREVGTLWRPPFLIDVTDVVHDGDNTLTITVANRWVNRLIGDETLPQDARYETKASSGSPGALVAFPDWWRDPKTLRTSGRIVFATWSHYGADSLLLPSGLVGPVRVVAAPVLTVSR